MTSNSGLRLGSRSTWIASTRRSNGASSCANASSTVSFTVARKSTKDSVPSTVDRRTTVLTKKPTTRSSSGRLRPDTTVPSATSSWPAYRANSTWQAATSTVNSVVSRSRASRTSRAVTSRGTANWCTAPAVVRTAGRGRSVGSSSGAVPASWRFQ